MLIDEMTKDECRAALEGASIGRLGCARDGQPYIVPIYFACDGKCIYGVSKLGQKIEWMRYNPLVCLQTDERKSHYQWMSIVVSGRYEELPDTREYEFERVHAYALLQKRANWWQPALVGVRDSEVLAPIYYRVHIVGITGHRATPDAVEAASLNSN